MKKPDTSPLEGKVVNNLKVIERSENKIRPNGKKRPVYKCECLLCGNVINVESQTLRGGGKKDCGCESGFHHHQSYEPRQTLNGRSMSSYRAKSSYFHMLGRCYDENESGYENYGGRGITVCDRWRESFWNFLEDIGERPQGFVLDRINPNKNYEPDNCRWVNRRDSSYNTRRHSTNTSGRTGVYWFDRVNKWTAAIFVNGLQKHLGYFSLFEDAVKAREDAELKYYGELKVGERILQGLTDESHISCL